MIFLRANVADFWMKQKLVYETCGLTCQRLEEEKKGQEYGAYTGIINNKIVKFRTAKITPKKVGQFVTLWKRSQQGPIVPYDLEDKINLFVISVIRADNFGQFIFPKELLFQKGFVSKEGKGGKLAMRVYPSWDIPTSEQARKTQGWQLPYFIEIQPNLDRAYIEKLFR